TSHGNTIAQQESRLGRAGHLRPCLPTPNLLRRKELSDLVQPPLRDPLGCGTGPHSPLRQRLRVRGATPWNADVRAGYAISRRSRSRAFFDWCAISSLPELL